jgi:hypothetical protein
MTEHNEQDVERRIAKALEGKWAGLSGGSAGYEAVWLVLARAALDAMGLPSREQVVHMLFEQTPDDWDENDIGILADAFMALLPAAPVRTVTSVTWRCDACNYPNEDGDSEYARCAICGGEYFTVETAATHVCGETCRHRSDCGLHNAPACYEPGNEAMTDTHDCTPAAPVRTVTSVEDAVGLLTRLVGNETQAWNVWNVINTDEGFVGAFTSHHPAPEREVVTVDVVFNGRPDNPFATFQRVDPQGGEHIELGGGYWAVRYRLTPAPEPASNDRLRGAIEAVLALCRSMDRGVGYRVPGDHSTWGEHAEGKADFAAAVIDAIDEAGVKL